ncbi:protein-L-isoaspartate O-methyltransferase family protein [Stenoxybacter acetivorans]|uniref:protein-L-isoaspartate O-methyltransferase family protein n=1 Tax=Stenoxybacter acetivorans TaxID=422441 RepID=UPI000564D580|nr:protein-L-isoaspartate O-methyltransferase [Stenoxybacter acetivorans]
MDFTTARFNMVEQQIRPWDVLNFDLLDVLSEIPRERFVQENQKGFAYADAELPLPNGGFMLEPKMTARLIQALDLKANDSVLEIGTGSGYATAVLAKMAGKVLTIDSDAAQQNRAKAVLDVLDFSNIAYQTGDGLVDVKNDSLFNAIYLGGSVPVLPDNVSELLTDGGRLVAVVGEAPVMKAVIITRKDGQFEEKTLFETVVPSLKSTAATKPSSFQF